MDLGPSEGQSCGYSACVGGRCRSHGDEPGCSFVNLFTPIQEMPRALFLIWLKKQHIGLEDSLFTT